jgi:hypothetical protein
MKQILLTASIFLTATTLFAQSYTNKIKPTVGKMYNVATTSAGALTMQIMGNDMEIPMTNANNLALTVQAGQNNTNKLEFELKRIAVSVESPTGAMSYDSDKKDASTMPMAEQMNAQIGKKIYFTVDENGNAKPDAAQSDEFGANPLLSAAGGSNNTEELFNPIPSGIAYTIGQPITDEFKNEAGTTKRTILLKSVTDSLVVFEITKNNKIASTVQMQGMDLKAVIDVVSLETIKINPLTGLVNSKDGSVTSNGTMNMMGADVPISGKINLSVIVTEK